MKIEYGPRCLVAVLTRLTAITSLVQSYETLCPRTTAVLMINVNQPIDEYPFSYFRAAYHPSNPSPLLQRNRQLRQSRSTLPPTKNRRTIWTMRAQRVRVATNSSRVSRRTCLSGDPPAKLRREQLEDSTALLGSATTSTATTAIQQSPTTTRCSSRRPSDVFPCVASLIIIIRVQICDYHISTMPNFVYLFDLWCVLWVFFNFPLV